MSTATWTCPGCTTVNEAGAPTCSVCGSVRTAPPLPQGIVRNVGAVPGPGPGGHGRGQGQGPQPVADAARPLVPLADPGAGRRPTALWWAVAAVVLLACVATIAVVASSTDPGSQRSGEPPSPIDRDDGSDDVVGSAPVDGSTSSSTDASADPAAPPDSVPVVVTVTTTATTSTVLPVPPPVDADGLRNRWIAIRSSAGDEAEVRRNADRLEPGLAVMSTDGHPALRHPNWLAYAGPFDAVDDAARYCQLQGVTDFNACTIVLLDPTLTSNGGRPTFCSSRRAIIRPDGGWDWWDASTNATCR